VTNYSSLRSTKCGRLNWMKTPSSKRHSCSRNGHDTGTDSSMFIWASQSHGLLCHKAGTLYTLGRCSPGELQPLVPR